jgi:hypothetical protein
MAVEHAACARYLPTPVVQGIQLNPNPQPKHLQTCLVWLYVGMAWASGKQLSQGAAEGVGG